MSIVNPSFPVLPLTSPLLFLFSPSHSFFSADAAGFPIAPLLVTADELASGSVDHALRFIVPNRLMAAGQYVHPASHAGTLPSPSYSLSSIPFHSFPLLSHSSLTPLTLKIGGPSSSDPNAIPYGAHLRLRADFNPSSLSEQPASSAALVVIAALKKYGMFLADGVCVREVGEGERGEKEDAYQI